MEGKHGARKYKSALFALVLVLIPIEFARAQAQTATISGTATDPSGAALVNASVKATNTGTNISQSTQTDAQGRYTIPQLQVGTYSVEASLTGFKTVVHGRITLSVGATVVVDFQLPVGQVSETVNVEGQVSQVQTETSEVSTLVSPQQMRDLPLNGRNFEQLLTLAPGVATLAPAFNAVTGRLYGMMDNYSIAGSRPTGQMFLLDNTDIRDFWEHGTGSGYAGTSLGVEAIGEFQVLTNSYSAQFAGNGAVMNATSRSGTNDLHGGGYEFIRNSYVDALDLSDKAAGLTAPPPFKRNQFGGDLGGPIKKDKLFFFGNYEGLREGLETTTPIFVPEPYVAAGMLPCSYISPNQSGSANCKASTAANSTDPGVLIAPVPGANSLAEKIAAVYANCKGCRAITPTVPSTATGPNGNTTGGPLPGNTLASTAPGYDLGGYYQVNTAPNLIENEDYVLGRADYTIGPNDSIFGRYVIDDARVADNPRDPLGIFPEKDFTRNQFFTLGERHVISPTMVNSIHFGFVRNNENSRVQNFLTSAQIAKANAFSTAVGGPGVTSDPLTFSPTGAGELPRQDGETALFEGIQPVGPDQNRPDALIQSKFSGGDDLVWTHGSHSVKIGGVVTRIQTNNDQTAYANGQYYLSYAITSTATTYDGQWFQQGLPLLAFAVPSGANNSTRYFREIMVQPYIQDDWKVLPQLTLNIGFRYDYDTNPVGWALGNKPLTTIVGSFLPTIGPLGNSASPYAPFTAVKHVFAHNPNAANFEPRFGFAWDIFKDHKTSLRGGVGLFDDATAGRLWESGFIATPPAGFSFLVFPGLPNAYSGGFLSLFGGGPIATAPAEFAGVTYTPNGSSPYQLQYNLMLQHEIFHGTVLSVAYVGSVSRHLWTQGDTNPPKCVTYPNCTALPQIPSARPSSSTGPYTFIPGSANACSDPNQNNATAPGGAGTGCYGSGVQFPCDTTNAFGQRVSGPPCNTQGDRINTNFGEIIQAYNTGASSYNSLQVSLNHQFAKNFNGQFNYTYSRCVDNGSFASSLEEWAQLVTDRYNEKYDYANCNFDIRHNISANGLYALPFKGNRLIEGWQISTIIGVHTGLPINIYNDGVVFSDPADLGTEWDSRANYSYAPGCSPNHIIDKRVGPGTIQWFDPSCYEAQAPGFLGNIKRNSVKGPGAIGADLSLTKNTKLTERLSMQLRLEAFNFINHLNPGAASPVSASVLGAINVPASGAGRTSDSQSPAITPRQLQAAVKFDF